MLGQYHTPAMAARVRAALRTTVIGVLMIFVAACETTATNAPVSQTSGGSLNKVQQALFDVAREAEASNNYEQAAGAYGRLYEQRVNDSVILSGFIRNMRYSGRVQDVISYVEQKAQHLINEPNVQFEYAKALLVLGRKEDSLRALKQVRLQIKDNWQVHSAIGITLDAMAQYENALQSYQTALKLSPNNAVVINNMAMSLAMSGKLPEAISALERAAGLNRQNSHIRQNLALLYAIDGRVEQAQALAAMDLDMGDLETNLSFYRRFEGVSQ